MAQLDLVLCLATRSLLQVIMNAAHLRALHTFAIVLLSPSIKTVIGVAPDDRLVIYGILTLTNQSPGCPLPER